jgi:hypothetical protein
MGKSFIGEIAGCLGKVDVGSGLISTVVGGGHSGKTVEGSSALSADFWSIDGLAIGDEGNLFIADAHQGKSFKVDGTSGLVTRVAGTGEQGFGGDGESARNASFRFANVMSVDKAGNLFVTGEVNQNGSCAAGNLEPGPYLSDAVADSTGNDCFVEGAMDIVQECR